MDLSWRESKLSKLDRFAIAGVSVEVLQARETRIEAKFETCFSNSVASETSGFSNK